jgi:hypothetical protein
MLSGPDRGHVQGGPLYNGASLIGLRVNTPRLAYPTGDTGFTSLLPIVLQFTYLAGFFCLIAHLVWRLTLSGVTLNSM